MSVNDYRRYWLNKDAYSGLHKEKLNFNLRKRIPIPKCKHITRGLLKKWFIYIRKRDGDQYIIAPNAYECIQRENIWKIYLLNEYGHCNKRLFATIDNGVWNLSSRYSYVQDPYWYQHI